MAEDFLTKTGKLINNTFLNTVRESIYDFTSDVGYLSPLEVIGDAVRTAKLSTMYYSKTRPYCYHEGSGILRLNDALISISGESPPNSYIDNYLVNGELEKLRDEIIIQN